MVNNIDVAVETDPARIRDALYRQAFDPVRWVECVRQIKAMGIDTVVEYGLAPGIGRHDQAHRRRSDRRRAVRPGHAGRHRELLA